MAYHLTVVKHGRFFDAAAADGDVAAALDLMKEEVATQAFDLWNGLLETRIRVNQYRYMSGNRVEPRGNEWVVHDDLAKPYGPWLEGLGSRNSPVTRFPGYHSLSDAYEAVNANAANICQPITEELVASLNEPT